MKRTLLCIYESPSIPTVQTDPEIVSSSTLGKLNLYMSNSSDILWLRKFKCLFKWVSVKTTPSYPVIYTVAICKTKII